MRGEIMKMSRFRRLWCSGLLVSYWVFGMGLYAGERTVEAVQDGFVKDGGFSGDVFGAGVTSTFELKFDAPGFNRKAWVRFDLGDSHVDTAAGATLRLTRVSDLQSVSRLRVYALRTGAASATAWMETTLTWDNAPANNNTPDQVDLASALLIGERSVVADEPTDFAVPIANLDGIIQADNTVSLILTMADHDGKFKLIFAASEHPEFEGPRLTFEENLPVPPVGGIYVVDRNESNLAAEFHSLPEAIEQVEPGATIYLMPSGVAYEPVTVTKPVSIIGSGYEKDRWFPSALNIDSIVSSITVDASNVFLSGLVLKGNLEVAAPSRSVTIFRNSLLRLLLTAAPESLRLKINHLNVVNNRIQILETHSPSSLELVDVLVANNIVDERLAVYCRGDVEIVNNVLLLNSLWTGQSVNGLSGRFSQNILQEKDSRAGVALSDAISYQNNVVVPEPPRALNRFRLPGISNVVANSLEEVVGEGENGEPYVPVVGGPAVGLGSNGGDAGVYGGIHPWNPNQQPPIPIITRIQAPRIVGRGEELEVLIEVQTNN